MDEIRKEFGYQEYVFGDGENRVSLSYVEKIESALQSAREEAKDKDELYRGACMERDHIYSELDDEKYRHQETKASNTLLKIELSERADQLKKSENECTALKAEAARMRERETEIFQLMNHLIPFYAYGNNEAAVEMANRMEKVRSIILNSHIPPAAPEKAETQKRMMAGNPNISSGGEQFRVFTKHADVHEWNLDCDYEPRCKPIAEGGGADV